MTSSADRLDKGRNFFFFFFFLEGSAMDGGNPSQFWENGEQTPSTLGNHPQTRSRGGGNPFCRSGLDSDGKGLLKSLSPCPGARL